MAPSDISAFDQGLLVGTREEQKRMKAEFKKVLNQLLAYAVQYGENNAATYTRQLLRKMK